MQLKNPRRISGAVALAAGALMGNDAAAAAVEDQGWQIDTALLYYAEKDRVSVIEPVINMRRELEDEEAFELKVVYDSLSGASPSGANLPAGAQTVTSPSGYYSYVYQSNGGAVLGEFVDRRVSVSAGWERRLGNPLYKSRLGFSFSSEYDFISQGVDAQLSRDFNNRNTTLSAGLAYESDVILPASGIPTPLSAVGSGNYAAAHELRSITDILIGVTQVLGRNTIARINYNQNVSQGYQNDPYKVLADNSVIPSGLYFESRPDSRIRESLYAEIKHALSNTDIVNASYRYQSDDWGVISHTLDLRYRHFFGEDWYIEPHGRFYQQSAAFFWLLELPAAPVVGSGQVVSGDYRLGELVDTSWGARIGKRFGDDREWSLRVESFMQSGDSVAADVTALIVEFGYSFHW